MLLHSQKPIMHKDRLSLLGALTANFRTLVAQLDRALDYEFRSGVRIFLSAIFSQYIQIVTRLGYQSVLNIV